MRLFCNPRPFVVLGVFVTTLAEQCLASTLHRRNGVASLDSLNLTRDLVARDAYTDVVGTDDNEGEDHNAIEPPNGSEFTSIKVLPGSKQEIALFQTKGLSKTNISHAYIAIHGKLRDGDRYWKLFDDATKSAYEDGYPGAGPNAIVVAPEFFSKRYNSGQYTKNQLAWGDINAWQAAEKAVHPEGTNITSTDAIDALVRQFSDSAQYPNLTNVTVVGHGGGGQLVQRYAALAAPTESHVHVRYIHGDASSCVYFTADRPTSDEIKMPAKGQCSEYDTWRYGFTGFPGKAETPQEYFKRYAERDVISIVGYQDTKDSGDQTCMARIQGGDQRRDRNLMWYRYVNSLARTKEDLVGLPGGYDNLPDWGHLVNNTAKLRLIVVENATHDAAKVFGNKLGRSALFSNGDVELGWRPGKKNGS